MNLDEFKLFMEDFNDIYFSEFELLKDYDQFQSKIYSQHHRYLVELFHKKKDDDRTQSFCDEIVKKLILIQQLASGQKTILTKDVVQSNLFEVFNLYTIEIDNLTRRNLYTLGDEIIQQSHERYSKGGKKSSSIYNVQRKQAEQIYQTFKKKNPILIEEYKKNPRKNKTKTALKKELQNNIKANLCERTFQLWSRKLLETKGILIKNENN